jgi:hypothetical protein
MMAIIRPVKFVSHIADQDFSNQFLAATTGFLPLDNSSLILSKIRILASIAIQIDNTNQAIVANVITLHPAFNIAKTTVT